MSSDIETITEDPSSSGDYDLLCEMADAEDNWKDSANRSARRQRELLSRDQSESYAAYCAKTRRKLRPDLYKVNGNKG